MGEREGRDYLFLSRKMFESRIKKGYFLEWEKVFDQYYGTPKRQVLNLLKKDINVLLCIDVKGAKVDAVTHEFTVTMTPLANAVCCTLRSGVRNRWSVISL